MANRYRSDTDTDTAGLTSLRKCMNSPGEQFQSISNGQLLEMNKWAKQIIHYDQLFGFVLLMHGFVYLEM